MSIEKQLTRVVKEENKYKLSFDEWYKLRHFGFSFETQNMAPGQTIQSFITVLSREIRDYVSEMVQK